jgi:ribosome-associated protein
LTTALLSPPTLRLPSSVERAAICARTARDHKARDIVVLDMRGIHPLYDFFILCTGSSRRQIHTLAEEVDDAMRAIGDRRDGIEGYQASKWVVQDYGDLLVHVFDAETRAYYSLEELWADAPRIDWEVE